VFSLSLAGKLTTLHRFSGKQTAYACPGLVQGSDGNFYGTTYGFTIVTGQEISAPTVFKAVISP